MEKSFCAHFFLKSTKYYIKAIHSFIILNIHIDTNFTVEQKKLITLRENFKQNLEISKGSELRKLAFYLKPNIPLK